MLDLDALLLRIGSEFDGEATLSGAELRELVALARKGAPSLPETHCVYHPIYRVCRNCGLEMGRHESKRCNGAPRDALGSGLPAEPQGAPLMSCVDCAVGHPCPVHDL